MKVDPKKELKGLYTASAKQPALVDVPTMSFLMIDGAGDPNTSEEYRGAVEALYSLSYTLKFTVKKGPTAVDYAVMPLEGLWWAKDLSSFGTGTKNDWLWTAMIMQPEYVTKDLFSRALNDVGKKKDLPALTKVRFGTFHEGPSAQIMHIGPWSAEAPTIEKLHKFIADEGHSLRDKHHEIYLGDPRRSAPEKLKTIIRQPIG